MSHDLQVITRYDDGHESVWTYTDQPGSAQDAHDALARRWENAGHTFTRDRAHRVLTRRYEGTELGTYTDEIRHEEAG